jgi:uncharacterized protein YhaN
VKLSEFCIQRYGPLQQIGVVRPGPFCLLYGRNEEGKTLTVEALVRLLLGKNSRHVRGIGRVDESPEGWAVLQKDATTTLKLPEDGDVATLSGIPAEQWRNIFLIRNSDLQIEGEAALYTNVADSLTGLRTREIQAVTAKLLDIGRLTPTTLDLSNSDAHQKLRSRIEQARGLLGDIDGLRKEAESKGLDHLEVELLTAARDAAHAKARIDALERARKRGIFQSGREALSALLEAQGQVEGLEAVSQEGLDRWRDARMREKEATERIASIGEQVKALRNRVDAQNERIGETEAALDALARRMHDADDLEVHMRQCEDAMAALAAAAPAARLHRACGIASAVLALVALAAGITTAQSGFAYVAVFFGAASLVFILLVLRHTRSQGREQGLLARLCQLAAGMGIEGETVEAVRLGLTCLKDERAGLQGTRDRTDAAMKVAQEQLRTLSGQQLPRARKDLEDAHAAVERIRHRTGATTIEQYRQALQRKTDLLTGLHAQEAVLENLFGGDAQDPAGRIAAWHERLDELQEFAEAATGVDYTDAEHRRCQQILRESENRREELRDSLQQMRRSFADVARRAAAVLDPDEAPLLCESMGDLKALSVHLQAFVEDNMEQAELARRAIGIFREIERDEHEKVAKLFGPGSQASASFDRITAGEYDSVHYVHEDDSHHVRVRVRGSGALLDAEWLSGGAYDQLYMAIRLALGQAVSGGHPGLFVLDDPFVKADSERLSRQLDLLLDLVAEGWQILYFTAKEEVREALAAQVADGTVSEKHLPGIRRS